MIPTLALLAMSFIGYAADRITCSTPELQALVRDVSQNSIACPSLLKLGNDPHGAEVIPSMLMQLKQSDFLIVNGLGLEESWVRKALMASQSKIKWDTNQVFVLGPMLNPIPGSGHSHDGFNPHVLLSPKRVVTSIEKLGKWLTEHDCKQCEQQSLILKKNLEEKIAQWKIKLDAGPQKVASFHGAYDYFLQDFGIKSRIKIEDEQKGATNPLRLLKVNSLLKQEGIQVVLIEPGAPSAVGEKLKALNPNLRIVRLPTGLTESVRDLSQLFDLYVSQLVSH